MRTPITCSCGIPLTGGRDTFGDYGDEKCLACFYAPTEEESDSQEDLETEIKALREEAKDLRREIRDLEDQLGEKEEEQAHKEREADEKQAKLDAYRKHMDELKVK